MYRLENLFHGKKNAFLDDINGIGKSFTRHLLQNPARISILGFAILIFTGMLLLMLPQSSAGPKTGWVNALFTSTSATCVTGLTVVDTSHDISLFGQMIILVLIQIGGLGIMTVSTLLLLIAGRKPSLAGRIIIQDTLTHGGQRSISSVLRDVALFTFVVEGLGAGMMFLRFFQNNDAAHALYLAVFHSVSAFCNAGFSLFSDGFLAYTQDWGLNLVTCF